MDKTSVPYQNLDKNSQVDKLCNEQDQEHQHTFQVDNGRIQHDRVYHLHGLAGTE
jgi:hypothetical protein